MYVMVTTENCPRCSASKQILTKQGLIDQVKIVSINDTEGMNYAKKYNLTSAGSDIICEDTETKMTIPEFIDMMKGR